jgi:hypothetical protein
MSIAMYAGSAVGETCRGADGIWSGEVVFVKCSRFDKVRLVLGMCGIGRLLLAD